ncbi:hypothetical protein [uncultured Hoeflea sp.]|uniref:hypothetical protein n=1 Tax=uncultured Hoeflea sp. TaxID=538666 RepID=UPI002619A4A3|nr:hypothetical protein [uncultured Hoeflea sp.]
MIRIVLAALAITVAVPAHASGRWDAISSGRLYDRLLTPQLNPSHSFVDDRALQLYRKDLREGRIKPPNRKHRHHLFDFRRN